MQSWRTSSIAVAPVRITTKELLELLPKQEMVSFTGGAMSSCPPTGKTPSPQSCEPVCSRTSRASHRQPPTIPRISTLASPLELFFRVENSHVQVVPSIWDTYLRGKPHVLLRDYWSHSLKSYGHSRRDTIPSSYEP